MRIGLIGLGRIGTYHAANLVALDEVDQLVVTDAVPAAVASAVERFGAAPAASVEHLLGSVDRGHDHRADLVAPRPDPAVGGGRVCRRSARSRWPRTRTRPGISSRGSRTPACRCRSVSRAASTRRSSPPRRPWKSGELGFLTTVRSTTMDPAPPPLAYIAGSGGIFRDCAIHDLDAVRWVTGREVVEVYATGANKGDPEFAALADVDTASALLTFDDGTLGVISNTRYNGAGLRRPARAARFRRLDRRRSRRRAAAGLGRAVGHLPGRSGPHVLHGPAGRPRSGSRSRPSSTSPPAGSRRRAPWPTGWSRAGSPRPAPARWPSTDRSGSSEVREHVLG